MMELTFACNKKDFFKLKGWESEISQATEEEENLLFQSENKLLEIAEQKRIILALNADGEIVGSIVLWDIGGDWNEVGTVYVFSEYRNQGIGQAILRYALRKWNGGRKVMSTSKDSRFIHLAIEAGMIPVYSCGGMEQSIQYTCVCGKVDGVLNTKHCPFRDKKCVFLISQATAKKIGQHSVRNDEVIQCVVNYSQ